MKGLLFLGFILITLLVATYGLSKDSQMITQTMRQPNLHEASPVFSLASALKPQVINVGLPIKEGFVNPGSDASLQAPEVIVPVTNPRPAPLEGTTPAPYLPPVELEYGPAFGDIARINTLPYKDPALESAPYKRLAELKESLQGFLAFEAKSLSEMSDPSIQLPLTTLRGDFQRVKSEVDVLKRNPGINSNLTQGQADEIQANLNYLQRKYRLSVNAASGNKFLEGFANPDSTESVGTKVLDTSNRLNLEQTKEVKAKIVAEILRLSGSGTTDPNTNARINMLNNIKNNIDTIITEVENGTRTESDIPITEADRDKFLPLMGSLNEPLPQLLNDANLPISVANAFPSYASGDATGAKIAQTLFQNYGDALFKGLSWDLKFTSPNEVEVAKARAAKVYGDKEDGLFMAASGPEDPSLGSGEFPKTRGEMESVVSTMESRRLGGAPKVNAASFDWKEKSKQICDAIRRRGLDPGDFGCTDPNQLHTPDYSWRGNARMVCTRLMTTPDPGLPELCGCPPLDWAGWRS